MPFWTYLLHCNSGKFYAGHTDDLERRIADHKAGRFAGFTSRYQPVELVWSQEFTTRDEAKESEKQIKGWSRKKKLALIRGDWDEISRLARRKGSPSTGSGQAEVLITPGVVAELARAVRDAHRQEACGILTGTHAQGGAEEITGVIPARNVHPSPGTHFEIDPQALIDAHRAARTGDGPKVLGYFHSHPTGPAQPSETDIAMSAGDGMIWAIAGLSEGGRALGLYRAVEGGFELLCRQPLEG